MEVVKVVTYDAVTDADGKFSSEFRNYVWDRKLLCEYLQHEYFARTAWLFRHDEQADGVDSTHSDLTNKLVSLFKRFYYADYLVQFWKARELDGVDDFGERRVLLTTRNQPFLIRESYPRLVDWNQVFPRFVTNVSKGIFSYRMGMDYIVTGEVGGGIIGRVYQSNRLEYSPDIRCYSSEEYPHRDFALSCGIKSSLAIPMADSFGRLVGVFEVTMRYIHPLTDLKSIIFELQRGNNLRYLDNCKDLCGQCNLEAKPLRAAVSEIMAVMKVIAKSCGLIWAQTWILCDQCISLSLSQNLHEKLNASYRSEGVNAGYGEVIFEFNFHLKNGEGVVGKAASSTPNLVYCEDVSKFSITQYPFAHLAHIFGFTSCFAIGLKSDLTKNQIYVLEFFLDPRKVIKWNLKATLAPILEAMKQNFQTFKLSSGEEMGDNLSVRVIEFASGEEIGDNLSVQVIDGRSPTEKIVSLGVRERDFISAFGMNNNDPTTEEETSSRDTSIREASVYSASTVQCECRFTIEVNYEDRLYTFLLFSSSEINDLSRQVHQRLNLEDGTYDVIYFDEDNDRILLTCTDDLREYIENSMKQERYTLMMKIEPK